MPSSADRRGAQLFLDTLDLHTHAVANLGIHVGQRLIEEKHRWLANQRASQAHALLLPLAELSRQAVEQAANAKHICHLVHALLDLYFGHLVFGRAQRKGQVVVH